MNSTLTKSQYKHFGPRAISGYGDGAALWVTARFDDECGNGHNTFAITGDVRVPRHREPVAGGCLHDDIARVFPELAKYIKWHLCSTDGPMHYLANALYFASDRDHYGRRKGEVSAYALAVEFADFPLKWRGGRHDSFKKWLATAEGADFEVIAIPHDREPRTFAPNYTLGGAPDKWHECPFDTEAEALEFLAAMQRGYKVVRIATAYSEGKAREFEHARLAAIWPEATDEELSAPDLKAKLEARLPGLLAEFRAAMEELGFTW